MKLAMHKGFKAQFWSFDVIFSIIIFSVAITILTFTWFNLSSQLSVSASSGSSIMQLQTQALAQALLTPGVPANWQSTINTSNSSSWPNISVGLTAGQGTFNISSSKLYTLMAMANNNYQSSKLPLGVAYDYYINIKSSQSNGAGINVSMGKNPLDNKAVTVYVQRRSSFVNGLPATITVMLWTGTQGATS